MVMKRDDAFDLVKQTIKDEKLMKHMLAVESIMREIAKNINEDVETFGLTGLLHDIDFEETKSKPAFHGILAAEKLNKKVCDDVIYAIKAHNFHNTGIEPKSKLDYALIASDAISGLIIACALIKPSKKLSDINSEFVANKFKQKDFARNCDRDLILYCKKIGLGERDFFELALKGLKNISIELGL